MNEKGDLALLDSLMSKYAANLDLRQEIVQSTTRDKIKVLSLHYTTLRQLLISWIQLLEEKLKMMDPERVAQVIRAKEAEIKSEHEAELQHLTRVLKNNPTEKLKFDEHIRKVKERIHQLEDKRNEVHLLWLPPVIEQAYETRNYSANICCVSSRANLGAQDKITRMKRGATRMTGPILTDRWR